MPAKGLVGRGVYPHKALLRTSSKLPRRPRKEGEISLIALHSVRSIDSNWKNNKKHTTPGAASSENDRVLFGKRAEGGKCSNSLVQIWHSKSILPLPFLPQKQLQRAFLLPLGSCNYGEKKGHGLHTK